MTTLLDILNECKKRGVDPGVVDAKGVELVIDSRGIRIVYRIDTDALQKAIDTFLEEQKSKGAPPISIIGRAPRCCAEGCGEKIEDVSDLVLIDGKPYHDECASNEGRAR